MNKEIQVVDSSDLQVPYSIDKYPDICPVCHVSIVPIFHFAFIKSHDISFDQNIQAIFLCANQSCSHLFIAHYEPYNLLNRIHTDNPKHELKNLEPVYPIPLKFSKIIEEISQNFCNIYKQAFFADQLRLSLVAGPGYRKALEFLIKDYLIHLKPEKEADIKKKFLGKCIKEDIENENIKLVADRAVWLGNDETHYDRIWKDKDITDLKTLINLTVKWIEMEETTKNAIESMPDKK